MVDGYYHKDIDWEPQLAQVQVEGYLREVLEQGAGPEDLMERWNDLSLFHFFLDHYGQEIQTLDDLQPYHLSEWVTDFLDRKIMGGVSVAQKRQALESVRSLYLNDVWLIQVCHVEFTRDWRRMRKEARKTPGAALKLRLIGRLQQAQKQGQNPFPVLYSYPPTPEYLDEASYKFHKGEMTEDRAW